MSIEVDNVSGLKNKLSDALRKSHQVVLVVMDRDQSIALKVGVDLAGIPIDDEETARDMDTLEKWLDAS